MTKKKLLRFLGSLELSLVSMGLLMALVLMGTFAQVRYGIYFSTQTFFNSFWVIWPFHGVSLPIFPGGWTVGILGLANLTVAHFNQFRWDVKQSGIVLIHFGLIVLLLGAGLTGALGVESQMQIAEGQTAVYSEDFKKMALDFVAEGPTEDIVTSIPQHLLENPSIQTSYLPFVIEVNDFWPNVQLRMDSQGSDTRVDHGIGQHTRITPIPVDYADDQVNQPAAIVTLRFGGQNLGTYLVSSALKPLQSVTVDGRTFQFGMRPTRYYNDFALTLRDFVHERYAGTEVPSRFASQLRLTDPQAGENRDVEISMNEPLRYKGKTYYQASFGQNDRLTVLQVVENPAWPIPYIACVIISLGLLVHFAIRLGRLGRKSAHG